MLIASRARSGRLNTTQDVRSHILKTNGPTKQHIAMAESRPLFRIEERSGVAPVEVVNTQSSRGAVFPREMLLAARGSGANRRPDYVGLCIRTCDHVWESAPEIMIQTPVSCLDQEREYLRSLLEFRAFKTSGLMKATWQEWNIEAQNILTGALLFGCSSVASEVYEIMQSNGIIIDSETFSVLIEASLKTNDIVRARMFLDHMTCSGLIVDRNLAKRVEEMANSYRPVVYLNKDAPIFVPKSLSGNHFLRE